MWSYATLGRKPRADLAVSMARRALLTAGEFKPQGIANLIWSYATLGMERGAELAEAMARRAVLTAGEFKPQEIANLLWACAALGLELAHPLCADPSSLSSLTAPGLCQLHQCFLCMDLEASLRTNCVKFWKVVPLSNIWGGAHCRSMVISS